MTESEVVHDSEFAICARLARSLSHLIRGDLAVITNDLVYLSAIVDPNEVERARTRCVHVAKTISKLGSLATPGTKREVPGPVVLQLFGIFSESKHVTTANLVVDMSAVARSVSLLREIVGEWDRCVVEAQARALLVRSVRGRLNTPMRRFASCSAFAAAERGERNVVDGCIVDLIFRDHGWGVHIAVGCEEFEIDVCIPLKDLPHG